MTSKKGKEKQLSICRWLGTRPATEDPPPPIREIHLEIKGLTKKIVCINKKLARKKQTRSLLNRKSVDHYDLTYD